jgi:hypothetical protein
MRRNSFKYFESLKQNEHCITKCTILQHYTVLQYNEKYSFFYWRVVSGYPMRLSKLFSTFNKGFEFQPKRNEKHNKNCKRYKMRQSKRLKYWRHFLQKDLNCFMAPQSRRYLYLVFSFLFSQRWWYNIHFLFTFTGIRIQSYPQLRYAYHYTTDVKYISDNKS